MREERQVKSSLAHSRKGESWFLKWGEGRSGSVGARRGLHGLPTPFVVLCAGIMQDTLLLLPEPQKWQLGFGIFVSLFTVCATCSHMQLFLVSYSFFVFCCLRRCPGASTAVKGPRSQPVSNGPSPAHLDLGPDTMTAETSNCSPLGQA